MSKKYNLTLCMIVKNEADNIKETIENVVKNCDIDYWVISDTGSSDNTIDIIQETFKSLKIPGKFHNKDWKDFSTNRNYVIEEAEKVSNYLFFFDADDRIKGNFRLPTLTYDAYLMRFGPDFIFHRVFIVKTNHKWRYKGILHEYIVCDSPSIKQVTITGDYHVVPGTHGCRSKDPLKYFSDALVFEKALKMKDTPKDLLGRYNYYCAQSYRDCGNIDRAVHFYKETITSNGWSQEKYVACKMLGNHYKDKDNTKAIKYYIESIKHDSSRVECILELSRLFKDNRIKFKILTSIPPKLIANPTSEKYLFIDIPTHNVFYFNEIIITGYNILEWDIVCEYMIEQVKRFNSISDEHINCAMLNITVVFNKFNTKMLLDLYSEIQKNSQFINKEIPSFKKMEEAARNKIESVACNCDSIPCNIFFKKCNDYSISLVFAFDNIKDFTKTFNSFINCVEDKEYVRDYFFIRNEKLKDELLKENTLFNFMTHVRNIFDLQTTTNYTMYLDCKHYFCNKQKYFDVFIKKLSNPKIDYIQFNKHCKNNYFSRIIGHSGPLPSSIGEKTSFDIMLPFNESELIEIDLGEIDLNNYII